MHDRHSFDEFDYIEHPDQWRNVIEELDHTRVLAVDTEADSMHSYFEKVCLVQLATDGDRAYVVDPLALPDLEALREPLSSDEVTVVFHGADFDVTSLRRDYDFEFTEIFDTMVASQFLGDEKLSLRDLVERYFGVVLAKAHTRANWGKRPLTRAELEYSYLDVAYLVELEGIQRERLQEADLVEESEIEFVRLAGRDPVVREFDPHGWGRVKGARDVPPEEQAILHALHAVRDRHARKLDRPVFKVLGNDTIMRMAKARPRSRAALRAVKGVSGYAAGRMANELLDALERAIDSGAAPPIPSKKRDPAKRLDYASQKRLGRLRDWREAAAAKAGVTTMAILPNYAMFDVARERPSSLGELEALAGVGRARAAKWGAEMLKLVP